MKARITIIACAVIFACAGLCLASPAPTEDVPRFEEEKGMTHPKVIHKVDPIYPEEAKKEKVMGTVVVDAVIDTGGNVTGVEVTKDPDPRLSQAAVDAVKQWKFEPAKDKNGEAIEVRYYLTIKFHLQ